MAERCTDETASALAAAFAVGARRSALQDIRFLIDELVEIAARALSPGVNDPFTAVTCLDWMGAATSDLAARDLPSHLRADARGALRVIAHPVTFDGFLEMSFGSMAQYCASDMIASLGYLRALGEVAPGCDQPDRRAALGACVDRLDALSTVSLHGVNRAVSPSAPSNCGGRWRRRACGGACSYRLSRPPTSAVSGARARSRAPCTDRARSSARRPGADQPGHQGASSRCEPSAGSAACLAAPPPRSEAAAPLARDRWR